MGMSAFLNQYVLSKKRAGKTVAAVLALSLVISPVQWAVAAPEKAAGAETALEQSGGNEEPAGECEETPGENGIQGDAKEEDSGAESLEGTDAGKENVQGDALEESAERPERKEEERAAQESDRPETGEPDGSLLETGEGQGGTAEEESSSGELPEDAENIVENEIIVVYDDAGVSEKKSEKIQKKAEDALSEIDIEVVDEIAESGDGQGTIVSAQISGEMSVNEAVKEAMEDENVSYAQPNYKYELMDSEPLPEAVEVEAEGVLTNDLYVKSGYTYYLNSTRTADAWERARSNRSVTVAVFDSGCRLSHEDLRNNVLKDLAYDAYYRQKLTAKDVPNGGDPNGHGTHVSGLIAAQAGNGLGIAGTSYNANILPIKICDNNGKNATTQSILNGIYYCQKLVGDGVLKNLRVLNMSTGYYATSESYYADYLLETQLEDMAYGFNVLTVCAGGNGDSLGTPYTIPMYPSDFDVCLSVTALNRNGYNCSWSDFNAAKDISAPGEYIYSTYNRNDRSYVSMSGTSMAAPIVSGICALLWSKNLNWRPSQIKAAIEKTADSVPDNQTGIRKGRTGSHGAVNAAAALCYLTGEPYMLTNLSSLSISLSTDSYTYNGKARKPKVTVWYGGSALSEGRDYTVLYSNNVKVGAAAAVIKGTGRSYTGTVKKTFRITPKGTSISKLTRKSKGFKVKWKKQTKQTKGYQIQYSTSKNFKNAKTKTIGKAKTTSASISKLKKKKTYYVRIRTYKTVKGKRYCSGWSKIKKAKTK